MIVAATFHEALSRLAHIAPAGYAIALHIGYAAPRFLFQTYPPGWRETYTREGLMMKDPTVRWGLSNTGWTKWSALESEDEHGVFASAAHYGIHHGVTYATDLGGSRSIASFARGDRDFSAAELTQIGTETERLHDITDADGKLTPEMHASLHRLSVEITQA